MGDKEAEIKMYQDILMGKCQLQRHKNSNILLVNKPKTIMERSKNDIAPPQNLNPRLLHADKVKTQDQQRSSLSKNLLKKLLEE